MKNLLFKLIMISFFCSSAAHAAGVILLPKSGQTTSYTATDDGQLQIGQAWPSPRFSSNIEQTMVTDNLTKLTWFKNANYYGGAINWQNALNYVKTLNSTKWGGRSDWRIPNRKELMSLLNFGQSDPSAWLNTQGFSNVQKNTYWSSSSYAFIPEYAWTVSMSNSYIAGLSKTASYYMWPVCGGQDWSLNVAKTGSGTIQSTPTGISCGATCVASFSNGTPVTLTATPDTGAVFSSWSGCDSTTSNQCTVTMNSTKSVTANFGKAQFTLDVAVSGLGSGSVSSSPSGIACPGTCQAPFDSGTVVVMSEFPGVASVFDVWSGACSGGGECSVTMDAALSIGASFSPVMQVKNKNTDTLYSTLVEALTNSAAGSELLLLDSQHDGVINLDKDIILNGGWSALFKSKSIQPSILSSGLTIISGNSFANTLVVRGKLGIQGGSLRVNDMRVQ